LTSRGDAGDNKPFMGLVELLIARRNKARQGKDFAAADLVRDILQDAGIVLEDSASGTRWKVE
jgi:cysteinyl-tRNA synthetase